MDSPQNSQNFKEDLKPIGLKLFHTKQDGRHSKSFYETSITLIPKPDKDATHKREENCRLISLMNKNATILNKMQKKTTSRSREKKIIHRDLDDFNLEMQQQFNVLIQSMFSII